MAEKTGRRKHIEEKEIIVTSPRQFITLLLDDRHSLERRMKLLRDALMDGATPEKERVEAAVFIVADNRMELKLRTAAFACLDEISKEGGRELFNALMEKLDNVGLKAGEREDAFSVISEKTGREQARNILHFYSIADNIHPQIRSEMLARLGTLYPEEQGKTLDALAADVCNGRRGYANRRISFEVISSAMGKEKAKELVLLANTGEESRAALLALFGVMASDSSCPVPDRSVAMDVLKGVSEPAFKEEAGKLGQRALSSRLPPPVRADALAVLMAAGQKDADEACGKLANVANDENATPVSRHTALKVLTLAAPEAAEKARERIKQSMLDCSLPMEQRDWRMATLKESMQPKELAGVVLDKSYDARTSADALVLYRRMTSAAALATLVLDGEKLGDDGKAKLLMQLKMVHPKIADEVASVMKKEILNGFVPFPKRVSRLQMLGRALPAMANGLVAQVRNEILDDDLPIQLRAKRQELLAAACPEPGRQMEAKLLGMINDASETYEKRESAVEVLFELYGDSARGGILSIVSVKETPKKRSEEKTAAEMEAIRHFSEGVMGLGREYIDALTKGEAVAEVESRKSEPGKPTDALEGLFFEMALDLHVPLRLRTATLEMLGELSPAKKGAAIRELENIVDEEECLQLVRYKALAVLVCCGDDDTLARLVRIGQDSEENLKMVCEAAMSACQLLPQGHERRLIDGVLRKLDAERGEKAFVLSVMGSLHDGRGTMPDIMDTHQELVRALEKKLRERKPTPPGMKAAKTPTQRVVSA